MATVCDLCGKGARRAGHAVDLYRLDFARKYEDASIAIWLVNNQDPISKFCETDKVICAHCLTRLGVFESVTKEQLKRRKRLPAAPKMLPSPEDR
nr:MAG TPA: 50S ribosomal protein L2 [Caudoviricetes sp.]